MIESLHTMSWWPENLTDWIVIISGIATAVLVVIVSRQLVITKKEMDYRQRPWVAPITPEPKFMTFHDKSILDFDEAVDIIIAKTNKSKPDKRIYVVKIKNTGTIPAIVTYGSILQKKKFTLEELKTAKKIITDVLIMPGSDDDHVFTISDEDLQKNKIFYAGLYLEYLVHKKKSRVGKIWSIEAGRVRSLTDWIDDPYLKRVT